MLTRRAFLGTATAATLFTPALARAQSQDWALPEEYMPRVVTNVLPGIPANEIHISQPAHRLYLTLGNGRAIRYSIAVGEDGRQLRGVTTIQRKAEWPSWTPTQNMIRREPEVYGQFAGGMAGGPDNPLGARALYLYRGGRDTFYRIHGTPQPWTIGRSVSSGCIRMINGHVIDLFERVDTGTKVVAYIDETA